MLAAFIEHRKKTAAARAAGELDPILPDYLGRCFLLMAEKIGTKYNFSRYSYLDEMRDDAIENCIMAANNFDPEKSSNPFAYFTKTIWFAFLRRIEKEQKQTVIKYKMMRNMYIEGSLTNGDSNEFKSLDLKIDNEFMDAVVVDYEEKKKKKKDKSKDAKEKVEGVETFFEEAKSVEKTELETELDETEIARKKELDYQTRKQIGMEHAGYGLSASTSKKKPKTTGA